MSRAGRAACSAATRTCTSSIGICRSNTARAHCRCPRRLSTPAGRHCRLAGLPGRAVTKGGEHRRSRQPLRLRNHPAVLRAVADRLAQPADHWTPFRPPPLLRAAYPCSEGLHDKRLTRGAAARVVAETGAQPEEHRAQLDVAASGRAAGQPGDGVDDRAPQRSRQVVSHPGIVSSSAPGIAAAVALPPSGATSGSSSPCTTSAGTRSPRRPRVRSPDARIATICRATPRGSLARSYERHTVSASALSSSG